MAFLHRVKQDRDLLALALWGFYAALMTLIAYRSHFAILANDAFPLLFQAESLSMGDARSFYNGFFPIGYPILLRTLLLLGRQHVDATGVFFNLAIAAPMIYALCKLLALQGWKSWWALFGVTIALFLPEMVRGALSLRPDFIVTVLAACALFAYQRKRFGIAGLLLGCSCLFRTHALALVFAFALAALLFHQGKGALRLVIFALPFLLIQGGINLLAGESFFSSAQAFNVAKMINGADWRQQQSIPPSTLSIILAEPLALLKAYFTHLMTEWPFLLALIVGVCLKRSREIAVIALVYFLIVGLGGSPRGSLPIQPFVIVILFAMVSAGVQAKLSPRSIIPVMEVVMIFLAAGFSLDRSAQKAGARILRYQDVGNRLGVRQIDDAKRILTDDFAMYFPQIKNASPYANGGWGPIGIPLYRERMPQFMQSEPQKLHDALSSRGVNFIVLGQPSTDPRLEETVRKDTSLFFRLPDISGYAVYITR